MMTQQTIPTRSEIDEKYKWNAESVFPSRADLEAAFEQQGELVEKAAAFHSRLSEGPQVLREAMKAIEDLMLLAGKLLVYTNMAYSVDSNDQQAAKDINRAQSLFGRSMAAISFLDPELIAIGRETLEKWMEEDQELIILEHYLDDLFRKQAQVRSPEVEELLGMLADPFSGTRRTWNMLTDADFKFPPARSSEGEEIPFSTSTIQTIMASPDREARRTAWENFTDNFLAYKNTLASNLTTSVKQFAFQTRARRYQSPLEYSLFEDNIPVEVFHSLIETFRKNLPIWQRYWRVRRKALGVETLHPYDAWAPLTDQKPEISYEQSVEWIVEGMQPLGEDYVSTLRRGCLEQRWVDVYPNRGKVGGAFSSGWKGISPFIMMSYNDNLFSMSTLAHELGHSMHSWYSRRTQPLIYSQYSIFLAEVASNFNQAMVRDYLLKNNPDKNFQIGLIEEAMSNFHRYFFIMPTLARFELDVHERVMRGQGLSADDMISLNADLFEEAYGNEVHVDRDRVGITWATFLHMYLNFYVFQYATGIGGAHALAKRVLDGEPGAAEAYLELLKAGGSRYPLDILKEAGVDLATPAPVEAAFEIMEGYIVRLEELTA
jgi:oligoendopeptidase F